MYDLFVNLRRARVSEQILTAEKVKQENTSFKRKGAAMGLHEDPADEEAEVVAAGVPSAGAPGAEAAFAQLLSFMQGHSSGSGPAFQPIAQVENPGSASAKQAAKKQKLEQNRKSSDEAKAAEKTRVAANKAAAKAAAKAERDAIKQQTTDKKQMTQTVSLAAKSQIMLVSLHDTLKNCDLKDAPEPIAEPLRTLRDRMAHMLKEANAAITLAKKKDAVIEPLTFDAAEVSKCTVEAKAVIKKFEQFKLLVG